MEEVSLLESYKMALTGSAAAEIFFPLFWQGQIGSSNTFETQQKIEKARLQSFLQSKCLEQHQRAL